MDASIDSVAIAVRSLPEAKREFEDVFGIDFSDYHRIEPMGVETAWGKLGSVSLQLLAPTAATSALASRLEGTGPGVFGIVVRVPDLDAALARPAIAERVAQNGQRIEAGFATEVLLRPSRTCGALFVLREWST